MVLIGPLDTIAACNQLWTIVKPTHAKRVRAIATLMEIVKMDWSVVLTIVDRIGPKVMIVV